MGGKVFSMSAAERSKCVVLVPVFDAVDPQCDAALDELARRGYVVRIVRGYSQIDLARSRIATTALDDGFEETFWIDGDVVFHPDDVDRLRDHGLPLSCGLYAKKASRALACHVLPGAKELIFGEGGGLVEILYGAMGFLHARRQVYLDMEEKLHLPRCNEKFGEAVVPYFLPLVIGGSDGPWYLSESFAFCEKARQCGYKVWADTTIRLGHIGRYSYSWEDAGSTQARHATYRFRLSDQPRQSREDATGKLATVPTNVAALSDEEVAQLAHFVTAHPWPEERPTAPPNSHGWLRKATRELLASVLNEHTQFVLELGSWLGQSTRFIADQAPNAVVLAVDHWNGSSEHQSNVDLRQLLPTLYETFLTNCWDYRGRIVPWRTTIAKALEELNRLGLSPQVVYLDAEHSYEAVKADLAQLRSFWPNAVIVGDDWDFESVRRAATDVAREHGGMIGVHGVAWRFLDKSTAAALPSESHAP